MEAYYLAALQRAGGMGSVHLQKLLEVFVDGRAIWQAPSKELASVGGLPDHLLASLDSLRRVRPDYPKELAEICDKKEIRLCSVRSADYPKYLKEIFDPPVVFFYRGSLPKE